MLAGKLVALAALAIMVGAGGIYVAGLNAPAATWPLLKPPLPSPVRPYIVEAARVTEGETQRPPPEHMIELAQDILRRAPLSAAPFILVSDVLFRAGDTDRAREFALLALRRDPRNVHLHLQLANDAAQRGDLSEVVKRLSLLLRVDPQGQKAYLAAMLRVAGTPDGPRLIEVELASKPQWGGAMVNLLTPNHPDLNFLGRIARAFPNAHDGYISRMALERGAGPAHAEWLELLPSAIRSGVGETPFNPTFDPKLSASPPFDWRLRSSTTEIGHGGGLYASYDGRGHTTFVEQLLILSPGAYQIEIAGTASDRPRGGTLAWTLTCRGARSTLLGLTLKDSGYKSVTTLGEFLVPAENCDGQYLRLVGIPSEFVTAATAEIASVRVIKKLLPS